MKVGFEPRPYVFFIIPHWFTLESLGFVLIQFLYLTEMVQKKNWSGVSSNGGDQGGLCVQAGLVDMKTLTMDHCAVPMLLLYKHPARWEAFNLVI